MNTESLKATDAASAAVATHPRVTLDNIKDAIAGEYFMTGEQAVGPNVPAMEPLSVLTICILVMSNGFTIIGKSAPASPENFDPELGRKFAYEDAIRQAWPLMGFALRDRLCGGVTN